MPRFNVDQNYVFINVKYDEQSSIGYGGFSRTYLPWCHKLKSIDLELLTCVDRQLVPNHWDEASGFNRDRKYDGFCFEDRWGRMWHNHYRDYSSGQISTDGDNWIFLNEEKYDTNVWKIERLESRLNKILSEIPEMEKMAFKHPGQQQLLLSRVKKLKHFYNQIVLTLEETFGMTALIIRNETYEFLIDFEFVPSDQRPHNVLPFDFSVVRHHPWEDRKKKTA